MTDKWEGSCLCGAVRYQATGTPVRVNHCHCIQCQKASGAGVATWIMFERSQVDFSGAPLATYRSSATAERQFCPHCHSCITWKSTNTPQYVDISAGTLDTAPDFAAEEHLFWRSKVRWLSHGDDLPKHDTWRD